MGYCSGESFKENIMTGKNSLKQDTISNQSKSTYRSHSISSNQINILNAETHMFCKHLSKILNCLYILDLKKRALSQHDSFSIETTFLRIINNPNNTPQLREERKFNFESFLNFLKGIGIHSKLIKSQIDLFSHFDIQQQCCLGM